MQQNLEVFVTDRKGRMPQADRAACITAAVDAGHQLTAMAGGIAMGPSIPLKAKPR
ncbi:hypothetical protein SynROS8604_03217 [Synechococcus sp. ROS8604]|nr:hypothetical protein SynROS8604_03217 [Synechococcus sp. ROS8604]